MVGRRLGFEERAGVANVLIPNKVRFRVYLTNDASHMTRVISC